MNHHRHPAYIRNARLVRQHANTNPDTRCWRCHRTATEHQRQWHAGHTLDGDPLAQPWLHPTEPPAGSWLRPECAECNLREGGNRAHNMTSRPGTTRQW